MKIEKVQETTFEHLLNSSMSSDHLKCTQADKDNKELAIYYLMMALRFGTRESIISLQYDKDDESVLIIWDNNDIARVNVACDSACTMLYEVMKYIQETI